MFRGFFGSIRGMYDLCFFSFNVIIIILSITISLFSPMFAFV